MKALPLLVLGVCALTYAIYISAAGTGKISADEFNPGINLILNSQHRQSDHGGLERRGFQLGGGGGLVQTGFLPNYNELGMSVSMDDQWYALLNGATVYAEGKGKWVSEEAYNLAEGPLMHDVLIGGHSLYIERQGSNQAFTKMYLLFGVDIAFSISWQVGANYDDTDVDARGNGADVREADGDLFHTVADVVAVDSVYKWAPGHRSKETLFESQPEDLVRNKKGKTELSEEIYSEEIFSAELGYAGKREGHYLQEVYQF